MQLPNKIVVTEYNPESRAYDVLIKGQDNAGFYCVTIARAGVAFSSAEALVMRACPIWADCEPVIHTGA